ncbi:MAG: site-2 protease family protein, partial [Neisseriaceae bacterium]|nr:site-2 protease family protein [Neisseriaceae bacterium]
MLFTLKTIIAFIVALLILVSVHEYGHYLVARLFNIKVLRFSIGFGKPFWSKKKGDTEWCLAPIPLGGYVKMVDTREGEVAPEDLPYAFDKQHPLKRIAVVVAGPLTNLILAVVFFAVAAMFGVVEVEPMVGTVVPNSVAERAGIQENVR